MKKLIIFTLALLAINAAFAQTGRRVSGVLKDSTGTAVIAASIKLISASDTLFTRSDINGAFNFSAVKSSQFLLSISSLGYYEVNRRYLYKDGTTPVKLDPIVLKVQSNLLNTVEVSGSKGVVVKQDTVEYRASDYPVRENSVAEDIIKKLPGVEVDKDGNVTTQGKSVTRVRVNGKDYFEGDLKSATQNLPAEIIEKIQIIDDYGDQAAITGIREGEADKIINIQIRPDRNKGMIVNANGGGGSEGRYQFMGNGQFLNNDKQLAVIMNFNNTNANIFNFMGGGGRGYGGGGRRSGNFGGGGNFYGGGFGGNSGITTTSGGGINYRDSWGKKINIYGSYRFTDRNTDANSNSFDQSIYSTGTLFTKSLSDNNSALQNHSFNFNMEYRIDSLNYLRISPYIGASTNNADRTSSSFQSGTTYQNRETTSGSSSKSPFVAGNLIYNHRFSKLGRNLSVAGSLSKADNESYQEARDEFIFYRDSTLNNSRDSLTRRNIDLNNDSWNSNINFTYSEPIGKYSRLDFGYNYTKASYDNSRITRLVDNAGNATMDSSLSNIFNYSFTTNRYSLNYRFDKQRLYNLTVGVTAQPTLLSGFSVTNNLPVRREGFNLFPTARFSYYFARSRSLTINYSGRSTEPSFSQIQDVRDVSDPQRPVVGNPNLKAAFTQSVNINYNTSRTAGSDVFFSAGLNGNIINDRITRSVVNYQDEVGNSISRNIQETSYINADGYYSTSAYYNIGRSFSDRKYRLSLNGSVDYSHDVIFTDNVENIGKNWSFSQRMRLQINPNQNVEIYPAIAYRRTWLNYSLPIANASKAETWSLDLNGKFYVFKTFIIGFDASKDINNGYGSIAANPFIINTYLEKQLFNRKGAFRIQAFDVMKEGTTVSRSISANSITDSQNNRLTRYVMATFSYRFQKFPGGIKPSSQRERDPSGDGFRGGRGFRPE